MVHLEPVKRITVTEQVMEQIAGLVINQKLAPGTQLPNERDLAESLGVTRGRVREALRALSLVGLITIKAGEGSFVNHQETPIPVETITWMFHSELNNIDEVYATRKLIETEVYLQAAEHATEQALTELTRMVERLSETRDPEKFHQLIDQCDIAVGEMCGNRILAKLMQTMVHLRKQTSHKILQVPGSMSKSAESRRALLHALQTGDRKRIREIMETHLTTSKQFYASHVAEGDEELD
ncbi:FadR/GntR family transcriptional regulator [Paenibacillus chartarius]|uniref:FadR/GntR family transcriptional regulator n=1 Tax=Paenibacillus chartarius TaxID=747481 RepID=A0ABV6DLV0_9BACL